MANNNMKQIKFDMLIKDIYKAMTAKAKSDLLIYSSSYLNDDNIKKFNIIYGETTPLCIFFDTKSANYYQKSVFSNDHIVCFTIQYGDSFPEENSLDDRAKKLYLTKILIEICICHPQFAVDFIFCALLAACVNKTDYEEKLALIAAFAHAANIDELVLFDMTQIIKIIFGQERENIEFKIQGDNPLEIWCGFSGENLIISSRFQEVLSLFKN